MRQVKGTERGIRKWEMRNRKGLRKEVKDRRWSNTTIEKHKG